MIANRCNLQGGFVKLGVSAPGPFPSKSSISLVIKGPFAPSNADAACWRLLDDVSRPEAWLRGCARITCWHLDKQALHLSKSYPLLVTAHSFDRICSRVCSNIAYCCNCAINQAPLSRSASPLESVNAKI